MRGEPHVSVSLDWHEFCRGSNCLCNSGEDLLGSIIGHNCSKIFAYLSVSCNIRANGIFVVGHYLSFSRMDFHSIGS